MDSEIESLKDNNVFTVIPLPNGKKAVGGRWVYSLKNNPNGDVAHKAKFAAKGYAQVKGSDYSDTFSPTAKMTTVRMLMQVSADYELVVHQLDVKTAYLNAPIDCEVYTIQPEGYKETKDGMNLVWKLNKSLYGLKQSGGNWNFVLSEFFQQNGFRQSEVDACLYFKHGESVIIFIVIWVDDIVIAASSEKLLNDTKDLLKNKFKMKDLGPISWFLGIEFKQTDDGIEMGQSYYLKGILERSNITDCKPRSTPCEVKLDVYDSENDVDKDESECRYREIVGSLVYAMTCSRPDLSWIVTKLSQHLSKPTKTDWMIVKHVLRYVKGTLDFKLAYQKSKNGLKIVGFSDSD